MKEISMASPKWPPLMRAEDVLDEGEYPEGDARSERAETAEDIELMLSKIADQEQLRRRMSGISAYWHRVPGTDYYFPRHMLIIRYVNGDAVIDDSSTANLAVDVWMAGRNR